MHTDLQLIVTDFPVHEDVIRVSLGPNIEISNARVECITCSTTNASYEALVTFDAVVGAGAVGPRAAAIQRGVRTLRSTDQVNIAAAAPPCVFGSEQLDLRDRSFVLGNLNAQAFTIGNDADILGDVLAAGNGSLGQRSTIDGFAVLGGTFTGDRAAVSGGVVDGAAVVPSLIQRTFPTGAGNTEVPNGVVVTLTPGHARQHGPARAFASDVGSGLVQLRRPRGRARRDRPCSQRRRNQRAGRAEHR